MLATVGKQGCCLSESPVPSLYSFRIVIHGKKRRVKHQVVKANVLGAHT